MSDASAPILSVRGLKTEFRTEDYTVRAVDGLSYELFRGETVAIVGESGSGKSVHALSIMGLLPTPPAKVIGGEILFDGVDLLKSSAESVRRLRGDRIAMIFQEPMTSLNPVMRIGEQIAEAVKLHKGLSDEQARERASSLLQKAGIPDAEKRLNDYPHQFSGGMRQRVMIAMALSCDPDILIADEPTTALDVTIQAQILELMRELQREFQMALVLITHNIGVVAEMADEVVVMYAGRAVEHAPAEELFRNPQHPYTRSLLASVPSIYTRKDRLASIPGQPPDLALGIVGCPFAPRCGEKIERCESEDAPLVALSASHSARCWLIEGEGK
ncbi:MAG: peptide ABC transporter ATP-binding protein [Elusimicrobia bacterium CG1_02_63_36]|nr:MAG: peptide ABC transporter ATP-binding protein [Elusimicrobia bacterium CG1_02_63_36]PIP84215.1 MAG: peptide ABC transporter ATP-binding protein [Elusimicrobia bacterium CG22_combo_CG10-13_8_21_14_all_63_91]PJA17110.1 MAG: peptide ABC transporter ATP-binding protein [Elusimicrobia bacterium CG_4_10_14_0_2_um_filter_63_34]PJB26631.1 MAG: peptide ABC transporter ATP-binding protein [Elusimicrobia bacterium CG_4_9_14_3_um_filter_62_55]